MYFLKQKILIIFQIPSFVIKSIKRNKKKIRKRFNELKFETFKIVDLTPPVDGNKLQLLLVCLSRKTIKPRHRYGIFPIKIYKKI